MKFKQAIIRPPSPYSFQQFPAQTTDLPKMLPTIPGNKPMRPTWPVEGKNISARASDTAG